MIRTAEEERAHCTAAMGETVGPIYAALWQHVAWVHGKWGQYLGLFGVSAEVVDLLNATAPAFFKVVQDSMWEDVILHLARLTDKSTTRGKDNLTMRTLSNALSDTQIGVSVENLTKKAEADTDFARDWRNRWLAHLDLKLALDKGAHPLKDSSRANIKAALASFAAVLNAVSEHFLDSTLYFAVKPSTFGAYDLVRILERHVQSGARE